MRFKILIFIFLVSCSQHYTKSESRKPYNATGLAYIFNNEDYKNKVLKKKLDNDLLQISHKDLKIGTLIKLINPKTKDNLVLKNIKKIQYPDLYKIMITERVASKLGIVSELPLIEILEINTQPGMTKLSLVPEIAEYKGISFANLIEWIIKDASVKR